MRAVGGLAQRLAAGLAQRRGKAAVPLARLRAEWSAIAGAELARLSRPEALLPARGRTGKALRLRVSGAAALEVQHRSGQLVERVNAYFGHRLIDDIRLVQGSVGPPAPQLPPSPPPQRAVVEAMTARVAEVEDPDLRTALARLGATLAGRPGGRRALLLGAAGLLCGVGEGRSQDLPPEKLLAVLPTDHVMGNPDAPNVLIDYASLTCPHCATFYVAVVPMLRRDWIETGKLRFVHRHFPSDLIATRAAQVTECAGRDGFFERVEFLFRRQVEWLSADDPMADLVRLLGTQGVTPDQAQACFADEAALNKVIADVQSGQALGVRFTPTVFVNDHFYGNPSGGAAEIDGILRQVGR